MTDTDLVTAGDSTENDKLSNPVTPETSGEADAHSNASDGSLATMVLPELRALANRSGVKGTSGMRKSELIAAIRETRQGGHANGASPNGGAGGDSDNNHDTKAANNHSESAVEDAPRTDSGERPSSGAGANAESESNGPNAAVLLGADDSPFPKMLGTMMKYLRGSSAMVSLISHSFSRCVPEYQQG